MEKLFKIGKTLSLILVILVEISLLTCKANAATTDDGRFEYQIENDTVTITNYLGDEEEVIIPDAIEGKNVEKLRGAVFYAEKQLKKVTGKSVTQLIGRNFGECQNLVSVDLPNVRYTGSERANGNWWGPFENCSSLEYIYLPKLKNVSECTFRECDKLKTIELPSLENVCSLSFSPGVDDYRYSLRSIENIYMPCTSYERCKKGNTNNYVYCSQDYFKPIHGEAEDWIVTEEPTCTTAGEKQGTCIKCGTIITQTVPARQHLWGGWIVNEEATCVATGVRSRTCSRCQMEEEDVIAIDSDGHKFTNYVYNNDAKKGVDGTETAICDYGCGVTDTRVKKGTALGDSGSSWGGGGYIPPSIIQKPEVSTGEGYTVILSDNGTKAIIQLGPDYELKDVSVNGISKGTVTEIKGLKSGDKLVVTVTKKNTTEIEKTIKGVQKTKVWITKTSNGKGWIRIDYKKSKGYKVDYYEVWRSKDNKNHFGKTEYYRTKDSELKGYYKNTKNLKKGSRYYYKIRGVRIIDGHKYYTQWSKIVYRTAK